MARWYSVTDDEARQRCFDVINVVALSVRALRLTWNLQLYISIIIYDIADRVFGPNTATQDVYDVAAKSVIKNAMEGINGKQFTPYGTVQWL